MSATFTITNDGSVEIVLPANAQDIERALNDCLGSRPPAGRGSSEDLSTYWLDSALSRIRKNDGAAVQLAAGNMSHVVLQDRMVLFVADYETHDDIEVPVFWVEALLEQWRSRIIEAAGAAPDAYEDDERLGRRTHASLRVFSDELSPLAISHLLGSEPTGGYESGDPVGRRGGLHATNAWILDSERAVKSQELGRHVEWLLGSVNQVELVALQVDRNATMDVFCYWEGTQTGPVFHPGLLSRIARLGLHLAIGSMYLSNGTLREP